MTSTASLPDLTASTDRRTIRAALRDLQAALRQLYGPRAPRVLVYGSYARGDEKPDSDLDVLLLYSQTIQPGKEIERLSAILASLNLRYQVLISILPANESDYQKDAGALWRNLRREGVPVERI